jgi:N-methylhydantoinase A
MDAEGNVVVPLAEDEVPDLVARLKALDVEGVVIHFIHAYANPAHERRCGDMVRAAWPEAQITLGSEIMPEVREFERGSTAAINGYVRPLISRYLGSLTGELEKRGFDQELLVMQGNGGMMDAPLADSHAVHTVMSGPAAGAIATGRTGAQSGFPNLIACDMGGTSFDVSLVIDGDPAVTREKELDYSVPVHVPMIDIHTIGAGGGSIARVNEAGILQVGPESAGADPGAIGYGRGGTEPTVTDANLVLGRINPATLTGVAGAADLEAVRAAMVDRVGKALALDPVETAAAILTIANNAMAGAIRFISVEKGHDPRDFALFAFGGAGPLHATALARELGIPTVLVPRFPGITSALGCVVADVRHDFGQSVGRSLREVAGADADAILQAQAARGRDMIGRENVAVEDIDVSHEADLLYAGQSHVIRIPIESPGFDPAAVLEIFVERYRERFEAELPEMRPVLMALRTAVVGRRPHLDLSLLVADAGQRLEDAEAGARRASFDGSWHETPVYVRQRLPLGARLDGPAIVEQMDTTTVVEPGDTLAVDDAGNLIVTVGT